MNYILKIVCLAACATAHTFAAQDITRGDVAALGSSSTVMTINQSGVYPLTTNYAGQILISANNVELDMQGFTINGGTYGVRITGNNCTVHSGIITGAGVGLQVESNNNEIYGLDLISNGTGMQIISGNNNAIDSCRALQNSSAGFNLSNAQNNMFVDCSAIGNGSNSYAYGFITQSGIGNTFENCLAENTATTGANPLYAAGFLVTGVEQNSSVLNCRALNASGAVNYGMYSYGPTSFGLQAIVTSTYSRSGSQFGIGTDWVSNGASYYIALGSDAGTNSNSFNVLKFNPSTGITQSVVGDIGNGSFTYAARWLTVGASYYVATGGTDATVKVKKFDPTTNILSNTVSQGASASVYSVGWLPIGSSYYLASTDFGGFLRIWQFDPTVPSLTAKTQDSGHFAVSPLDTLVTGTLLYMAISNNDLRIVQYDFSANVLNALTSFASAGSPKAFSWLYTGSSYYVAVGTASASPNLYIVQYNPAANTLTSVASSNLSNDVTALHWQQINNTAYLAVSNGSSGSNTATLQIFRFDPITATLSTLSNSTVATACVNTDLAWLPVGNTYYIAAGLQATFTGGVTAEVFSFDPGLSPQNNIFKDCQISGNNIGARDDAAVVLGVSSNRWLGNVSSNNTTNFNIGSQFPISAVLGTGVGETENIDGVLTLTIGGPTERIERTIVDQIPTLNAPMAAKVAAMALYGITAITSSPTTLTSFKSYCLATNLTGTVFILTSSFITLDLNGHTVGSISVTNSNFLAIRNGRVYPNSSSTDGLSFSNSGNILLQNIDVAGAQNGLSFSYASANDSSLFAQNCTFNNNSLYGVRIVEGGTPAIAPHDHFYFKCSAENNGNHGFYTGCQGGRYHLCQAIANGGDGFVLETANEVGNLFIECTALNNVGTGFNMQSGSGPTNNTVGACFSKGNGTNYSASIRFGTVSASNSGGTSSAPYWQNVFE